jgi:hypothetical protein
VQAHISASWSHSYLKNLWKKNMFTLLLLGLNAPTLPLSLFITFFSNTGYLPLPFLALSSLCVTGKGFIYILEPVITTEWSSLKEQHHEMFYFRVFLWIIFSQAPDYPIWYQRRTLSWEHLRKFWNFEMDLIGKWRQGDHRCYWYLRLIYCWGQIQSPWLGDKVDFGIGLPMVNVLKLTLEWT